jgi:acetyl esterase/lipase
LFTKPNSHFNVCYFVCRTDANKMRASFPKNVKLVSSEHPSSGLSPQERSCSGYASALRLRVHRPPPRRALPPVVLYLHAGRFISPQVEKSEAIAAALATRLDAVVIAPAYSLASVQPFPAAPEDAYAALRWSHDHAESGGWNARRIAVVGEEAGGNLAAVLAMMARDRDGPRLSAQVLMAPMLDSSLSALSRHASGEFIGQCEAAYQRYLPANGDRFHPYASPALCTRLNELAPALILSAEGEALRDEAESYGARLIAAGVKTKIVRIAQPGWSEAAWSEIIGFLAPLLNRTRNRPT